MIGLQMLLVMCTALCSRTSCWSILLSQLTPGLDNVLVSLLHTVDEPTLDDILHGMAVSWE